MPRTLAFPSEALRNLDGIRHWQTQPGAGSIALRRLMRLRAAIRRLKSAVCGTIYIVPWTGRVGQSTSD
jgi:hypothetical protein